MPAKHTAASRSVYRVRVRKSLPTQSREMHRASLASSYQLVVSQIDQTRLFSHCNQKYLAFFLHNTPTPVPRVQSPDPPTQKTKHLKTPARILFAMAIREGGSCIVARAPILQLGRARAGTNGLEAAPNDRTAFVSCFCVFLLTEHPPFLFWP